MPNELLLTLKAIVPYTGIAGISLLIFYFLFREFIRKQIFPQLDREQSYHLLIWFFGLIFLLTFSGILLGVSRGLSPNYQLTVIIIVVIFLLLIGFGVYRITLQSPQYRYISLISHRDDRQDILLPSEELKFGQALISGNGRYKFIMQDDGNLVLYRIGEAQALWATDTCGRNVRKCIMQSDGNLVLYGNDEVIWASKTHNNSNAYLIVQNDGNAVIYKHPFLQSPIWATNTYVR
jgi:hypothetical protein